MTFKQIMTKMTFAITFLTITLLMVPAASLPAFADHTTTVSPSGEATVAFGGNCYAYIADGLVFSAASAAAQTKSVNGISGHLATLNSAPEEAAADSASAARGWIGYTQDPAFYGNAGELDGDLFGWTTGETPVYTNWNAGEPNNSGDPPPEQYTENNRVGTFWNDLDSTDVNAGYFVEFEDACPDLELCNDDTGLEDSICKSVFIDDDSGNGIISIGENVTYTFFINAINNDDVKWFGVVVSDNFGGDLAVGDKGEDLTNWNHPQPDNFNFEDNLLCELNQTGKAKKEHLTCPVDDNGDTAGGDHDLDIGESAAMGVTAETDWNFGQSKKFVRTAGAQGTGEYTSCGVHEPNSGATIVYFLDAELTDGPHELSTAAFTVDVFQSNILAESDCDGDEVFDDVDECPFEGTEVFGTVDSVGCPIPT